MTVWDVWVYCSGRQIYRITAESAEEARRICESNMSSGLLHPVDTKVDGIEVESVTMYDEGAPFLGPPMS